MTGASGHPTVTRADDHSRIPSLDGLRAISISLVVLSHLNGTGGFPLSGHPLLGLVDWGTLGVRVFFVISGFLITGLLLKEIDATGGVSLRHFYFRRTMRIFPAYYVYILCMLVAAALGLVSLQRGDVLAAVTYTMNYHQTHGWSLGHAWSLAVEEQFYLIWPAVLYFAGVRRGLWIAAAFFVTAPVIRLALLAMPGGASGLGFTFETVADAIATGCLLAGFRAAFWAQPRYRRLLESRLFVVVPLLLVATATLPTLEARHAFGFDRLYVGAYNFVGVTVMNVAIALCIDRVIRFSDRPVGRLLNWTPLAFVGTISYSLYLWQQPFLNRNRDLAFTAFPVNLALAVLAALTSFYLIEKPALRLRHRLEREWRARNAVGPRIAT
jgi:peptidoglycan/LPS O-acetylase OafA/YrhL